METPGEISVLSMLLPLAGIVFIITVGVVLLNQQFQKNLYRQELEREELRNVHQHELLASSIEAQESERKRIAHDLHDELGATLSIARMHLLQLQKKYVEKNAPADAAFDNIRSLLENAMTNMRRISHELMPPQLEVLGLVPALDAVARQVSQTGQIDLRVNAPSRLPEIEWMAQLGVYRICMELINNTIRHAGASEATIDLSVEDDTLVTVYADNGKGLAQNFPGKGLGHRGIEGRVSSLGGSFEWSNRPSGGFYASARIPLRQPKA